MVLDWVVRGAHDAYFRSFVKPRSTWSQVLVFLAIVYAALFV